MFHFLISLFSSHNSTLLRWQFYLFSELPQTFLSRYHFSAARGKLAASERVCGRIYRSVGYNRLQWSALRLPKGTFHADQLRQSVKDDFVPSLASLLTLAREERVNEVRDVRLNWRTTQKRRISSLYFLDVTQSTRSFSPFYSGIRRESNYLCRAIPLPRTPLVSVVPRFHSVLQGPAARI